MMKSKDPKFCLSSKTLELGKTNNIIVNLGQTFNIFSSIVAEARSQGIDLAIVGTPQTAAHSNECVTAGNMTRGRLISLVGEMKMTSTTLDVNPLTLPDLTETFDVICSDRKKIK